MDDQSKFTSRISQHIWETKYRYRKGSDLESDIEDTWARVAGFLAKAEPVNREEWEHLFYEALSDFKFLPGGRILAGAGIDFRVTLFNCFVMGTLNDSISSIFDGLKEGAVTMQQGGGVGYDIFQPCVRAVHWLVQTRIANPNAAGQKKPQNYKVTRPFSFKIINVEAAVSFRSELPGIKF